MFRKQDTKIHFVGIGGMGMCGIAEVLANLGLKRVDGLLADLGFASDQVDDPALWERLHLPFLAAADMQLSMAGMDRNMRRRNWLGISRCKLIKVDGLQQVDLHQTTTSNQQPQRRGR